MRVFSIQDTLFCKHFICDGCGKEETCSGLIGDEIPKGWAEEFDYINHILFPLEIPTNYRFHYCEDCNIVKDIIE